MTIASKRLPKPLTKELKGFEVKRLSEIIF